MNSINSTDISIEAENIRFLQFVSSLIFLTIILTTIFGNLLVITAIIKTTKLQIMSNYLILSLAIADLIVGIVVMSPKAIIEVVYFGKWPFGAIFCDIWYTTFILCTSASILHLLVIAIDRYLTVTKTNYSLSRNWKKIGVMIFMAWFLGLIVAIGPISGWRDYEKFLKRIDNNVCYVTYKLGFIIFSQIILCYAPVAIIIPLYYVIYTKSRQKIGSNVKLNELNKKCGSIDIGSISSISIELSTSSANKGIENKHESRSLDNIESREKKSSRLEVPRINISDVSSNKTSTMDRISRRENRVAKTLAIVTITHIICLFPFSLTVLITHIRGKKPSPKLLFSIEYWLLHCNSLFNPIIYTIFNQNFRRAFKKILRIK
ncbi:unnamed protein product [Sphagnum jensenii]|uniref:G-protein coupled receptors family 1 profile domain-containing protein n=1 Tax=Sphagnum jensenii TaxID=128206 RepID=A0ABP0VK62_9BRYO